MEEDFDLSIDKRQKSMWFKNHMLFALFSILVAMWKTMLLGQPMNPEQLVEMSPMIRHYGVAHKKVKEAIGNEIVGKYIPESEMAPCRPAKNQHNNTHQANTQYPCCLWK